MSSAVRSRRVMLTVCAMSATIMQALDTTIANVALPYMQGSLSASLDQINWVLTSYIVASAIMTAPIGWVADRFGRKKLFIVCAAGFTFASVLCGLAQNIEEMVGFRLLQGAFGAALVPLSQAVLLDSYSAEERGSAMAIWGIGVMLGPIMGPTLGAWLTDNYSWHWVFFINLPVGIVTVIGLMIFMDETGQKAQMRFDWFGFLALAVGIGSLQLLLDRGEEVGWFDSNEIIIEAIISAAGFYFFLAHSLTTTTPFVRFELFKDRNFVSGCIFMVVIGVVLFGTMALVTPFMQNVMGYPILTAGFLLASRGIGTLIAMILVGRLMKWIEARYLVLIGLLVAVATLSRMVDFTDQTSPREIVIVSIIQGFGLGLVFVPLSTVAFTTLAGHLRTEGSAILTLVRNIGSSIGISMVIAELTSTTTAMHARLVEAVTPFNQALAMPDAAMLNMTTDTGRAMMNAIVGQQAAIIAYANDFKLLMYLTLATIPFVFFIGSSRARPQGKPATAPEGAPAHACDCIVLRRSTAVLSAPGGDGQRGLLRKLISVHGFGRRNSARILAVCSPSAGTAP
jgi:DHA2 family multidrug resistance protein